MKVTLTRQVTNVRLGAILRPGEHEVTEAEARLYRNKGWTTEAPDPPPAPAKPLLVPIPADWRDQHHLVRRRLAAEISGQTVRELTAAEADMIVLAEVDRRKGQGDAG